VFRQMSKDEVEKFRVKDLDWYDVETRIREICESLLTPVADMTG
jgi:hypothetical protein